MKSTVKMPLLWVLMCLTSHLSAQYSSGKFWQTPESASDKIIKKDLMGEMPKIYLLKQLDLPGLENELKQIYKTDLKDKSYLIEIPGPEGGFESFYIIENTVVAPEVAHLYTIKTYEGFAKDDPSVPIRCDLSPVGFHAVVYKGSNTYVIEPISREDNSLHIVYNKKDFNNLPVKCGVTSEDHVLNDSVLEGNPGLRAPSNLRTFELAYVASGEYSQQYGGSPYSTTNVLNSLASAVNIINPIFMTDMGIQFTLVTTAALVFPDPATDPFNTNNQSSLLSQNQIECDNALGNGGYDIGHLLVWANTGGLAAGGVVCWNPYKAEGFSGNNSSFNTLIIDYSCHEMGHQFDAAHNFTADECSNSVNNFRFEPGEGSSIMSYAGVCGFPVSYQGSSNPFFHSASIGTINDYITTWGGCETTSTPGSGNSADPVANAKTDFTIPRQTPFILVGSATDANDPANQLTYFWEQYDGSGAASTGTPDCMSTNQPLFKFEDPVPDNYRILPDMSEILNGNNNGVTWQKLPCTARTLNFNLVVRDNNSNWGRVGQDAVVVTVANTGPFAVTAPNGGEMWNGNSSQTVTWDVNNTNNHCANVDILISTDGGTNFNMVMSNVANDGSQAIILPNTSSTTARILVQCSTGVAFKSASTFFDVSDADFTINQVLPVELTSFTAEKTANGTVQLNWTTATETDNSHFEVEKSRDGSGFFFMENVESKGFSLQEETYQSIDYKPFIGQNYYRLKQVNFDQTFEYSRIISLNFDEVNTRVMIFPNPAKDIITLSGFEGKAISEANIYNQIGQIVLQKRIIDNKVDVSRLAQGIYVLEVVSDRVLARGKLIVE